MTAADFRRQLATELRQRGLLGSAAGRAACASQARAAGDAALAEVARIVGARTTRRALATRRGPSYADTYRYVTGYGALMTAFLAAPVPIGDAERARVARLGAIANLIVSHFDELVDGGWPRVALLPRWALTLAHVAPGRALLRAGAGLTPPQTRLIVRLVVEYFRAAAAMPAARRHLAARAELRRLVTRMYEEEGRTPREWERVRGSATRQKKTALPLVVLGLAAWLASRECAPQDYARHRRWLVRVGKLVRWIDDAADLPDDDAAGAANLVRQALARHSAGPDAATRLATCIALRGRRVVDEWRMLVRGTEPSAGPAILETVMAAWLGEMDTPGDAAE